MQNKSKVALIFDVNLDSLKIQRRFHIKILQTVSVL